MPLSISTHHPELNTHLNAQSLTAPEREFACDAWSRAGGDPLRFGEVWDAFTTAHHYDNQRALFGRFWDKATELAGKTGPDADAAFGRWWDAVASGVVVKEIDLALKAIAEMEAAADEPTRPGTA